MQLRISRRFDTRDTYTFFLLPDSNRYGLGDAAARRRGERRGGVRPQPGDRTARPVQPALSPRPASARQAGWEVCSTAATAHGPASRGGGHIYVYLRPRLDDRANGTEATVCGITLCGGSAWPAGFAHAARAANPQGHQRFLHCRKRHCCARRAQQAEPPPVVRSQRVASGCAHGLPSRDSAVETCGLRHAPIRAACGAGVSRVAA